MNLVTQVYKGLYTQDTGFSEEPVFEDKEKVDLTMEQYYQVCKLSARIRGEKITLLGDMVISQRENDYIVQYLEDE
jgi:hypothetical protein